MAASRRNWHKTRDLNKTTRKIISIMNTNRNADEELYQTTGERLNHLLDQIGFKSGRGRMAAFQTFLSEQEPEVFSDLKYTTVRSWFQDHAPPMKKVDVVMQALEKEYVFRNDVAQIKTWWKLGGFYPFVDEKGHVKPTAEELLKTRSEDEEKLQFLVMSLVKEEAGDNFNEIPGSELIEIKEKAMDFARDFADPFKIECPQEYLRMVIRHGFRSDSQD